MDNKKEITKIKSPYFKKGFESAIDNNGVKQENPYLESAGRAWEEGFQEGLQTLKELGFIK